MPLGVTIAGANANDGCQAKEVLQSIVVAPPQPEHRVPSVDPRSLPTAIADGAYGNKPTQQRGQEAGYRIRAPKRGQKGTGVGKIRNAVERCHNFFAQFGRIRVRLDRCAKRFLGWVQMAACVIFIRSGFVR